MSVPQFRDGVGGGKVERCGGLSSLHEGRVVANLAELHDEVHKGFSSLVGPSLVQELSEGEAASDPPIEGGLAGSEGALEGNLCLTRQLIQDVPLDTLGGG